ncbi:MAG: disulfide oxidoreductase [Clostridia bacterium]|jgi:hybrid cluster-associated redox disulfide protein|nr:disulfide oxidoreductase [Clostridia bacterium]
MKVVKETLIRDIVNLGPEAVQTLMNFGMRCIGCPASQAESIEQAATVHGIDVEKILLDLNNIQ